MPLHFFFSDEGCGVYAVLSYKSTEVLTPFFRQVPRGWAWMKSVATYGIFIIQKKTIILVAFKKHETPPCEGKQRVEKTKAPIEQDIILPCMPTLSNRYGSGHHIKASPTGKILRSPNNNIVRLYLSLSFVHFRPLGPHEPHAFVMTPHRSGCLVAVRVSTS